MIWKITTAIAVTFVVTMAFAQRVPEPNARYQIIRAGGEGIHAAWRIDSYAGTVSYCVPVRTEGGTLANIVNCASGK